MTSNNSLNASTPVRPDGRDPKRRRNGVTRIEFLVVAIVAIAIGALITPAIQEAREKSRHQQCRMNLKSIGLGLHNYADTYNEYLPPGMIANYAGENVSVQGPSADHVGSVGWSWRALLIPFVAPAPTSHLIDHALSIGEQTRGDVNQRNANQQEFATEMFNSICPSDNRPRFMPLDHSDGSPPFAINNNAGGMATTSYYGNGGSFEETVTHPAIMRGDGTPPIYNGGWTSKAMANGVFAVNSSVTLSDIGRDGTSNTIGVGEVSGRQDPFAKSRSGFYGSIGPNGTLTSDVALSAMRTGEWRLNSARVGATLGAERGFSSEHPGGANFLFMDGTVHFLSESMQLIAPTSLAVNDPRNNAGCDWAPVDLLALEKANGRCGDGVYGVGITKLVGFESVELSPTERSAIEHMESNYGSYQRIFSIND